MNDRSFLNDRAALEDLLAKHGSARAVAKATDIPRSTVQDAVSRLQVRNVSGCESCASVHISQEKQRGELSRLRAVNKKLALAADSYRKMIGFIDAVDVSLAPSEPYIASQSEASLVSAWTDWHYGAHTAADSINGMYEFSPEIMRDRAAQITNHISDQIEFHLIEDVVIVLNGDMANGMSSLHPDESTDSDRIAVQVRDCAKLVAAKLRDLDKRHPQTNFRIICNRGNHMRSTMKSPTSATDYGLSWEMLFGELVKAMSPERFHFHSEFSYRTYFQAGGVNWVSAHGHHFSGGGGATHIPEGSIKKFCEDADWALREINGEKLGAALFGHYHRSYMCEWRNVTAFVAGSPKGADSFGRDKIMDLTRPSYMSVRCSEGHIEGMDILRF